MADETAAQHALREQAAHHRHGPRKGGRSVLRTVEGVRTGHHCAQPIHRRFGIESTVRASLALHDKCEGIDALVAAIQRLRVARRHYN